MAGKSHVSASTVASRGFERVLESRYEVASFVGPVMSVAFHPDGTRIAAGLAEHGARAWNVHPKLLPDDDDDGYAAAVGAREIKRVRCVARRLRFKAVAEYRDQLSHVNAVAFSPCGRFFATGSTTGLVSLFDAATNDIVVSTSCAPDDFTGPVAHNIGAIASLDFAPDGSALVACGHTPVLLSVPPRAEDAVPGHDAAPLAHLSSIKLTTPGARLTNARFAPLPRYSASQHDAVPHKGHLIAVTDAGGAVHLAVQRTTGDHGSYCVAAVAHTMTAAAGCAFSPDRRFLVAVSYGASKPHDDGIVLCHVPSESLRKRECAHDWHRGALQAVDFAPQGHLIVTVCTAGDVVFWDPHHLTAMGRLTDQRCWIRAVAFNADGTLYATGGVDQSIRVGVTPPCLEQTVRDAVVVECLPWDICDAVAAFGTMSEVRLDDTTAVGSLTSAATAPHAPHDEASPAYTFAALGDAMRTPDARPDDDHDNDTGKKLPPPVKQWKQPRGGPPPCSESPSLQGSSTDTSPAKASASNARDNSRTTESAKPPSPQAVPGKASADKQGAERLDASHSGSNAGGSPFARPSALGARLTPLGASPSVSPGRSPNRSPQPELPSPGDRRGSHGALAPLPKRASLPPVDRHGS